MKIQTQLQFYTQIAAAHLLFLSKTQLKREFRSILRCYYWGYCKIWRFVV